MPTPRRPRKTDDENFRGVESPSPEETNTLKEENYKPEPPVRLQTPESGQTIATEKSHSMSMIDPSEWNLEEAAELETLPSGSEVCLRILSVRKSEYGNEDDGFTEYWQPTFEVVDMLSVRDFTHFLNVPNKRTMTPKQFQQAQYNLKVWMQWLRMDLSTPFNPVEDWPGMEGWAILSVKENAEYGKQNFVKPPSSGHASGGFILR
jgi:hypothetical protein